MIPIDEGAIDKTHIIGEMGELPEGKIPGRRDEKQITLYQSHGIDAQDMHAAKHIHQKALTVSKTQPAEFQPRYMLQI